MEGEKWQSRPYEDQELLSFDRIRRAVMSRIVERAEAMMDVEFPLKTETADLIVTEEWSNVVIAVKNSPRAKEAYRKHLEQALSGGILEVDQ